MTTKRIAYRLADGSAVVLTPHPEFCGLTVQQIALKDVPPGVPYKIIEASELPSEQFFCDAWEMDEITEPDGYGADYGVGSDKDVIGWNENGFPILRLPK